MNDRHEISERLRAFVDRERTHARRRSARARVPALSGAVCAYVEAAVDFGAAAMIEAARRVAAEYEALVDDSLMLDGGNSVTGNVVPFQPPAVRPPDPVLDAAYGRLTEAAKGFVVAMTGPDRPELAEAAQKAIEGGGLTLTVAMSTRTGVRVRADLGGSVTIVFTPEDIHAETR